MNQLFCSMRTCGSTLDHWWLLGCVGFWISISLATRSTAVGQETTFPPKDCQRILFLGDSITYAGHYIAMIETQFLLDGQSVEIINAGLPSETCSGLSEPDHPFPRPDVHERLIRCLEKCKPDAVVACYGMNDGIYHPFDETRFKKYQDGIRGIIEATKQRNIHLTLLTPPPFDPLPFRKKNKLVKRDGESFAWFAIYENYDDDVLKKYAEWVLTQKEQVNVIDLREPVLRYVKEQRKTDPEFVMSNDGVHLDQQGHDVLATTILQAWGYKPSYQTAARLNSLIEKRQLIYRDAWLTHIGHKRPRMKPRPSLEEANKSTVKLSSEIVSALTKVQHERRK
ncbi:MAG: SGNH/GDSL hydrolase family protein [Planctomycetota bacterium]